MNAVRVFCSTVVFITVLMIVSDGGDGNLLVGFVAAVGVVALLGLMGRSVDRAQQRRRDLEYVTSGLADVDLMPGVEFEKYIAARLRQAGWTVSMTAATGDYGVDLIARKDGQRLAIQCKRYGKPVGVSAIQQVVAGATHHRCTTSMVISNQDFTKAAKLLAKTHDCQLVGRAQLPKWKP